jgi:NAD(P)-dependent dehydrogenase (short-subunit alcohol dehydrogenase family)
VDLTDKTALITGGRRIGAVVATELARKGANVAMVYRASRNEAEATAAALRTLTRRAVVIQGDLQQPDACRRVVDDTVTEFGRLDILVNMASVYREKPIDDLTIEDWDTQLSIDLRAAWLCSQAAIPHMRRAGGGRIVNFSDWVARSGRPRYRGYLPYYVAKAGVIALTEALALELAADQILVNAIAPGPIVAPPGTSAADSEAVERATPLGRWGGELEIAKAVIALVESDFITGETDSRGRRPARAIETASRADFLVFVHVIGLDVHLCGSAFDLAGVYVELRPVPWALHGPAHQHAVRERSALVRAAILKRDISLSGPSDRDALATCMHQLHLIHGKAVRRGLEAVRIVDLDALLLPLAGVCISMVDANLVPIGERAAHPPTEAQRCGSRGFERQRQSAAASTVCKPRQCE